MTDNGTETKSLADMTAEVMEWCHSKGWYDKPVSFGEATALLHSEVSEAIEAWRTWGTADATHDCQPYEIGGSCTSPHPSKPEGVGSEFADILIRLLDDCGRFSVDLQAERERHRGLYALSDSFLENMNTLHSLAAQTSMMYELDGPDPGGDHRVGIAATLVFLEECCGEYGVDLQAEYERKMQYNRTRPYRHGKRQ